MATGRATSSSRHDPACRGSRDGNRVDATVAACACALAAALLAQTPLLGANLAHYAEHGAATARHRGLLATYGRAAIRTRRTARPGHDPREGPRRCA